MGDLRSASSMGRWVVIAAASVTFFALCACAKAAPELAAADPVASAAVPATPTPLLPPGANAADVARVETAATPQKFGAPIGAAPPVALADVAKSAKSFKGKSIVTTGTVAAVCQERGCWMEIKDEGGDANVRMHGHAFFVPKTASGKKARVEGTVVLMKDGKECDEMAATGAQLELDATGVELM